MSISSLSHAIRYFTLAAELFSCAIFSASVRTLAVSLEFACVTGVNSSYRACPRLLACHLVLSGRS